MPELQMSFQRFAQSVPLGSPDHVMLGPLKLVHGRGRGTKQEWEARIAELKKQPATTGTLRLK